MATLLLSSGLAVGLHADTAGAALPCLGAVTVPCVVKPGLVVEPILTNFPSYPSVPVNFAFAPDGKIFVADKSGQILVYSGRGDSTYDVVINIQSKVMDYWDRGLLGLAVDPQFGSGGNNNYIYFLYTLDRDPFTGTGWGSGGAGDGCPDPPAGPGGGSGSSSDDGCLVTARISKLKLDPDTGLSVGSEEIIFDSGSSGGWCEQFPSHSIGTLVFGPDGMLYAGAGDGASFSSPDWGQYGGRNASVPHPVPRNPCGDPSSTLSNRSREAWRGVNFSTETGAEGGSFRSQSVRSTVADGYQPYDGAIIRIDKFGNVPSTNPLYGGSNAHGNDDPIVAYGLRNPFRFNFKPGTQDIWLGDVGASVREEVSHATIGATGQVPNFGWPCMEGNLPSYDFSVQYHQPAFKLCQSLTGSATTLDGGVPSPLIAPVAAWGHSAPDPPIQTFWDLNSDAGCRPVSGGSSPGSASMGGSFPTAANWPSDLSGAYVFGDFGRQCVWALTATDQSSGEDSETVARTRLIPLASKLAPVSIQTGPDGAIYVLDIGDNDSARAPGIWRIGAPSSPIARFSMNPPSGKPGGGPPASLTVSFDASSSFVLPGQTITLYEWDLDGNGSYETQGGPTQQRTYTTIASVPVGLRITDSSGRRDSTVKRLMVGEPPVINGLTTTIGPNGYLEGDTINYAIDATDPNSSPLTYLVQANTRHCDIPGGTGCHTHENSVAALPHTASGSFSAPGHVGYSFLELIVTATNNEGLATTRTFELTPDWFTLRVDTFPPGLAVSRDGSPISVPYTNAQIGEAETKLSAVPIQTKGGVTHLFTGWADAPQIGPSRTIAPAAGDVSLIAQFAAVDGLTSITPKRVLDTRDGTGAPAGIVAATGVVSLDLRAAGLPTDATAALLNVTVTDGTDPGFVTVYPCTQPRPTASNLNYTKGKTAANLVQVAVDPGGTVCLYAHGATHLVADLSGWFQPTGKSFTPVSPTRVLDTRAGTGAPAGAVAAGSVLTLDLSSAPAGSTSAVLNVTSTEATGPGFVTVYPCGGDLPLASNLNVGTGDTRPNQVVVGLGTGNTVCLFVHSTMHLVADLMGWYGDSGQKVATQAPERVLDTRDGTGGTRAGFFGTVVLDLSAQAPAGATGVMLNVTGVEPAFATYVTAYPCDATPPLASNLNLPAGDIRPNLVAVPLSADKKVCLFTQTPVDLVADVAGWSVAG